MDCISACMTADHRACDERFANAEQAAQNGDWALLTTEFSAFNQAMERHFAIEEEILFPAFERRTGAGMGPTQVMRAEHAQIREVLAELRHCVDEKDAEAYLALAETLLLLTQQHNLKEENVLYPIIDSVLDAEKEALLQRIESTAH